MFLVLSTRSRAYSIRFEFKIITLAVELKSYSNVKGINSIKSWVLWSRGGVWCQTEDIHVWQCCFFCLVFRGGTVNWLPGSVVMVSSWQMLRGGRSPIVVVVLISRRWLKYIYCAVQLESPGLKCRYCIVEIYFGRVVILSEDSHCLFYSVFQV